MLSAAPLPSPKDNGAVVDLALLSRFDALSARDIQDPGSADAVTSRIAGSFQQAKSQGPGAVDAIGYAIIQNRLVQIPGCLRDDYIKAPVKLGMAQPVEQPIVMQTARHAGRHVRYTLPDADLVVIDRDILIRSALYLYFSLSARSVADALLAQAFVLAHGALHPRLPIPFQYWVVRRILADGRGRTIFLQCLNTLVDFVALHELGHAYADRKDAGREFFCVERELVPSSPASETRYTISFRLPGETRPRPPLGESLSEAQIEELFCDAFALVARTIMDASGEFAMPVVKAIPERLFMLSRFLFLEDMGAVHGEGPLGQVNIGRTIVGNRDVPPGQPMHSPPNAYRSHPSSLRRFDSLCCHAAWIFDALGVRANPLAPDGDDAFIKTIRAEWRNDVRSLQDMLIDALRGSEIDDDDRLVQVCDTLHHDLGLECRMPDRLKIFAMAALAPYLETDRWSSPPTQAFLADLAGRAALARLPPGSKLATLASGLCLTLLDPSGAVERLSNAEPDR